MHEPSDSSLLWDAVRVMVRLLREANGLVGRAGLCWRDHRRAAKKRARDIQFTRGRPRRVQLYRELIRTTRATLAYLHQAAAQLATTADWAGGALAGQGRPLPPFDRADHRADRAAGSRRRGGAGRRQAGQPVRAPCRHHPQGPRGRLRPQAQPDHRPERPDPRPRHRSGQSGRQRAPAADARAPPRALWPAAASGGRRRQLCQSRQPAPGQGPAACATWRSTRRAA